MAEKGKSLLQTDKQLEKLKTIKYENLSKIRTHNFLKTCFNIEQTSAILSTGKPASSLRTDFSNIFNQQQTSDIYLIFESTQFYVHSLVINHRCPGLLNYATKILKSRNFSSKHSTYNSKNLANLSYPEPVSISQFSIFLKTVYYQFDENYANEQCSSIFSFFNIKFSKHLGLLLETSINADLVVSLSSEKDETIRVSNTELSVPESVSAFLVHKIVLAARSKYIARQWSSCQMVLKISSELISAETMPLLLHFFYSLETRNFKVFDQALTNHLLKTDQNLPPHFETSGSQNFHPKQSQSFPKLKKPSSSKISSSDKLSGSRTILTFHQKIEVFKQLMLTAIYLEFQLLQENCECWLLNYDFVEFSSTKTEFFESCSAVYHWCLAKLGEESSLTKFFMLKTARAVKNVFFLEKLADKSILSSEYLNVDIADRIGLCSKTFRELKSSIKSEISSDSRTVLDALKSPKLCSTKIGKVYLIKTDLMQEIQRVKNCSFEVLKINRAKQSLSESEAVAFYSRGLEPLSDENLVFLLSSFSVLVRFFEEQIDFLTEQVYENIEIKAKLSAIFKIIQNLATNFANLPKEYSAVLNSPVSFNQFSLETLFNCEIFHTNCKYSTVIESHATPSNITPATSTSNFDYRRNLDTGNGTENTCFMVPLCDFFCKLKTNCNITEKLYYQNQDYGNDLSSKTNTLRLQSLISRRYKKNNKFDSVMKERQESDTDLVTKLNDVKIESNVHKFSTKKFSFQQNLPSKSLPDILGEASTVHNNYKSSTLI